MKLIHVVRRVNSIIRAERSEHLDREFEIHNVDHLGAVYPKLAPGHAHHNGIPLAIIRVPEHRRLKIIAKRIVRGCAICIEAAFKKLLLCHRQISFWF